MSKQYTADGRRKSSMTHAKHRHTCALCGHWWYGNGGAAQHGRAHVRKGEAVELVKEYGFGQSPTRFFWPPDDPRIEEYLANGFQRVADHD